MVLVDIALMAVASVVAIVVIESNVLSSIRTRKNNMCNKICAYICRLRSLLRDDWRVEKIGIYMIFIAMACIIMLLVVGAYYIPLEIVRLWNIVEKFFNDHALLSNLIGTFIGIIFIFLVFRPRVCIEPQLLILSKAGKKHLKVRVKNLGIFPVNRVEVQLLFYRNKKDVDKNIKRTKKIELLRKDMPILKGIFPRSNDSTFGCGTELTIDELFNERKVEKSEDLYEGIICRVSASHAISGVTYVREHIFKKEEVDEILEKNRMLSSNEDTPFGGAKTELSHAH